MTDYTPTKICSKCGNELPATLEYFYKNKNGLRPDCNTCVKLRSRIWHAANKEHANSGRRERRLKDVELSRRKNAEWSKNNKAWVKEYNRNYRQTHQEQRKLSARAWSKLNKDKINARAREKRKINPAQHLARVKRWINNHPEHSREIIRRNAKVAKHRRRARIAGASGNHTATDIKNQSDLQKGLCYWCLKPVFNKYHVDHVMPLSRGGSNGKDNIVISCPECNIKKGNKLPDDWDRYITPDINAVKVNY